MNTANLTDTQIFNRTANLHFYVPQQCEIFKIALQLGYLVTLITYNIVHAPVIYTCMTDVTGFHDQNLQ